MLLLVGLPSSQTRGHLFKGSEKTLENKTEQFFSAFILLTCGTAFQMMWYAVSIAELLQRKK